MLTINIGDTVTPKPLDQLLLNEDGCPKGWTYMMLDTIGQTGKVSNIGINNSFVRVDFDEYNFWYYHIDQLQKLEDGQHIAEE